MTVILIVVLVVVDRGLLRLQLGHPPRSLLLAVVRLIAVPLRVRKLPRELRARGRAGVPLALGGGSGWSTMTADCGLATAGLAGAGWEGAGLEGAGGGTSAFLTEGGLAGAG